MDTTQKINIPQWEEPKGVVATDFTLGYGKVVRAGWGGYSLNERKYFHQVLPAVFKKTLVLDSINGDRGIKWIITGPNEGFYITVKNNQFQFYKQYYNSFGFNIGLEKDPTYPQSKANTLTIIADRPIKAITVEMDYKLGLQISLNGKEVMSEIFIEDIRRNRIHLSGKEGKLNARIQEPENVQASVNVNPNTTFQKMLGWGGTTTPTAYHELSEAGKAKWWK